MIGMEWSPARHWVRFFGLFFGAIAAFVVGGQLYATGWKFTGGLVIAGAVAWGIHRLRLNSLRAPRQTDSSSVARGIAARAGLNK